LTVRTALQTRVDPGEDFAVVALVGDLDMAVVSQLHKLVDDLVTTGQRHVVLDLSGLRLCDASGLTGFIRAAKRFAEAGGWLRLAAPGGAVGKVFGIVAFGECVPTYATVPAAGTGDDTQRIKF
jgi:anti-anti-sigma factor